MERKGKSMTGYEETITQIILGLGDIASYLGLELTADPFRQPTLDEVLKLIDEIQKGIDGVIA